MGLALLLILGTLCSALFLVAVFRLLAVLSGFWDSTGYRLEYLILAPFRRFVWFPGMEVVRGPPCKPCEGKGVQILLGGAWSPIPPELLTRQKDGSHPKQANSRRCPGCQGLGFRWVRET